MDLDIFAKTSVSNEQANLPLIMNFCLFQISMKTSYLRSCSSYFYSFKLMDPLSDKALNNSWLSQRMNLSKI